MATTTAAQYLIASIMMGLSSFLFSTIPCLLMILYYIKDSRNNDSFMLPIAIINIMFVHILSVSFFVLIVKILIYLGSKTVLGTLVSTAFDIFWKAGDIANLSTYVSESSTEEARSAYSMLHGLYSMIQLFFAFMPIFVLMFSTAYGFQSYLKRTEQRPSESGIVEAFFQISFAYIAGVSLYIAFAYIASVGLFLPSGETLFITISKWWQAALQIKS